MIKISDITITVSTDHKAHRPDTVVEAKLEITEVCTVHRDETKLLDYAKAKVRHAVYHRLYGDLRDPIEEMYEVAMTKLPYGPGLDRVREAKKKIDEIMRGDMRGET